MKIIERSVIVPENESFIIREVELKHNEGVIHTHTKYELNYIVNAIGRRFVGGNLSRFGEGDLIFMSPHLPHCWEIDNKEDKPVAITIHFQPFFLEEAIGNVPEFGAIKAFLKKSRHGVLIRNIDHYTLKHHLQIIKTETKFSSTLEVIRLLKFLAMHTDIQLLANTELLWNPVSPPNERLEKVYEYVLYKFRSDIKLKEVADLVGLTEGAFCSFFKRYMKKTFFSFLKEVRIGYACKLLSLEQDMQVSEICFESGYNSFANFNRQFKEITSMSPREYRLKYH